MTAAAALVVASVVGTGVGLSATPAAALTPPVALTAGNLPTWQTNGIVWATAQAGGTVFAGGTFTAIRPPGSAAGSNEQPAVNFAAFDAATGNPTDCSLSFTISSGSATVRALTVSPDGKTLYAGGYFGAVNGVPVSSLAAIDIATCTVKTDFAPSFNATVRALAFSPDGSTLYAGGDFQHVNGSDRKFFAAVTTSGTLTGWDPEADEPGRAIAVTPDGQNVAIGGDFNTIGTTNSHALAVVDAANGSITKAYPNGFIDATSVVKSITMDQASNSFYTGNEGTGGGVFDGRIAISLSDFSQRWRDTCLGATQSVVVYKTVLYAGAHVHDCSSMGEFPDTRRKHLVAESVDNPQLLPWFPDTNDGIGEGIGPRTLTVASEGGSDYLWVGGEFTTVQGVAQQGLTRFSNGPDTVGPNTPSISASSVDPGSVKVSWQSAVDIDDGTLTYAVYRNGSSTPIYTTTGNSLPWVRPQLSFTDTDVKPGSSYSYRVTASDGTNTSALSSAVTVTVPSSTGTATAYPSQVLSDGASLYWRYDETGGGFLSDLSPSNDGGDVNSAPSYAQSPGAVPGSSTAMKFDGVDDYVYSDKKHSSPSTYSVETWFKTTTTSGGKLIGFGNVQTGNSGNYDKHVYMTNSGQLVFGVWTNYANTITSPSSYNDGAWHHVVATQGSDGMKLYVDGQLVGTNAQTANQSYDGYWRVGGDNLNGWPNQPSSNYFNGSLDETAVYPTALSAAQVAHHYALGTAPADTVTSVSPTEDTYVNAGAPSSTYGTSTTLAVRGTSNYTSYLRFSLPAAPSGQVLKSAVLQVHTSTNPSSTSDAGSTDDISVVPVTGDWTETGTTYKTRPTLSSTVLGTLSGATDAQTGYSVQLDASQLTGSLGGSYSLALTSTGTDALWLWSQNASGASNRPALVLTYGAP
jgi:hypothetical protein